MAVIISFGVKNYLSFKEECEFSMLASNSVKGLEGNYVRLKSEEKVLKTSLIYGRNASGKSNFLEAVKDFKEFVQDSTDFKPNQKIPYYKPFAFDRESEKSNSKFWIEFLSDELIKYYYEIEFNDTKIEKEALTFYPKGYPATLFERKGEEIKYGEYLKGEKKSIENQLLQHQLYLSKGAINNNKQLKECYNQLSSIVTLINFNQFDEELLSVVMHFIHDDVDENNSIDFLHNIKNFLRSSDTGILDIKPEQALIDSIEETDIPASKKYKVWSSHQVYDGDKKTGVKDIDFKFESSGSKKIAILASMAVMVLKRGGCLVIDELENSMHPLLSHFFIKLFHSKEHNKNNAQLIFSTHDVSLLDTELFRRDQIWFVDKDVKGNSKMYSISDFKGIRPDTPIYKWYMSGKFGAIPVISDLDLDLKL